MRPATLLLVMLCFAPFTGAFTTLDSDRDPSPDSFDDLRDAARWSAAPGTWKETGFHGLDGGIEYVVHESFCEDLLWRIRDAETCDEVLDAIQLGLDAWGDAHPFIEFVRVEPDPDGESPEMEIRTNPEIDGRTVAWASAGHYVELKALSTSGYEMNVTARALGFIEFDSGGDKCFHLEHLSEYKSCVDFVTTVAHEAGHVLGLGHPDPRTGRNFDSNDDPLDEIPIDCMDPTKGLKKSFKTSATNLMHPSVTNQRVPSNDDLGGLFFLYPVCPDQTDPPWVTMEADGSAMEFIPTPGAWSAALAVGAAAFLRRRSAP